ncbi:intraflagellar transport protein 172 homolog isoform X2 [Corticium candelabrum]|uniref:intraflagellar transport protein 172 homolog isoform X2 n=1 Tax=Corticium candelabrum TaxID=121492 RepID=UPI002E37A8F4|nr:intraflagellar transport protein 172 homolog isoform X2 [Corticium candelabrum]
MRLKHVRTLMPPNDGAFRVMAMAFTPNNVKLAVATTDRVIHFFDENGEKRDKFSTKPAEKEYGRNSYQVTSLAFSPDSTVMAVGQTDNIVYLYKVGEGWNDKKSIINKLYQDSAVTCLLWPVQQPALIIGLADGKVRTTSVKAKRTHTLYSTDQYVCSLAASPNGKGIISGHADNSIVRYFFDDEGTGAIQGQIAKHSCEPYALCWGSSIIAAGCDRKVIVYGDDGKIVQQFDYSREGDEKDFMCAVASPTGQSVVIGSFNRLRMYNYSPRRGVWDEAMKKDIANLYSVTALSWKRDGSRVAAGALCGNVELFDCALKRSVYQNKFEMTYVGLSQVIVKNLTTGTRINLRSHYGYEIDEVKIMGKDRYLVAFTTDTLLLGDLVSCKLSEVAWSTSGGNEKFFFENENVCMVFNAGELSIIEYGLSDILGSVRTENMNPHQISIRINERKQRDSEDNKKLAYLIDLKTAAIVDLMFGTTIGIVNHDVKIDWLELNETGRKLLFRDKQLKLHLYDIATELKTTILNYCTYVQWVPLSDVVVAQSRGQLCIWYNIDAPDQVTMFPMKGDILDIERTNGRTDVMVNEGVGTVNYTLDEGLIEFRTAIEDGDYLRAVTFLDTLEFSSETEAMWRTLADLSLKARQLHIAERCYAAIGDVARGRYLREVNKIANYVAAETGRDGTDNFMVRAKLAILNKEFKLAESIYLEQGHINEAMEMYQELHMWDESIAVAEAAGHPELDTLKTSYYQHLMDTNQEEKAGELREKQADPMGAINLYMKAGLPARAARVALENSDMMGVNDVMERIAAALMKGGLYEKAGEMFEKLRMHQKALEAYRKGRIFRRARDLSRTNFPNEVVGLEEEWGDHLVSQKQWDKAIEHFIEAGRSVKAIDAAIQSKQWKKAVQIVETQEDSVAVRYFRQIGQHFASNKQYQDAEKYFVKAGTPKDAVDMYIAINMWEQAHKLAVTCMKAEDVATLYISQAQHMESEGKYREAERLYVIVNEPDLAITMYKKIKQHDNMIRLVGIHHNELLADTHLHLAKEATMWTDAIRVAREYVPNKLPQLQKEYEIYMNSSKGIKSKDDLLSPAKTWEQSGDYHRAIDAYLKITVQQNSDYDFLVNCWEKAVELAMKFVPERTNVVVGTVCERLVAIERFEQAADLYLGVEMVKEALDFLMQGGLWDRAKRTAAQMAPQYAEYVSKKYKEYLSNKGGADAAATLVGEDPIAGLDMLAHQGQWDQCIAMAQKQGSSVLNKYVAMYATHCIKSEKPIEALQLFSKYGAPPSPQNFNIYKRLALDLFCLTSAPYKVWADFRDMLLNLTESVAETPAADTAVAQELEEYLLIAHYYAVRSACHGKKSLEQIAVKLTISLLRHSDVVPVDKAFYEAGIAAKTGGQDNMAFVFLNRFLDLCDAIEEGSLDSMDNSDLMDTDIPFEVPLPEKHFISEDKREEIKEWVLAVSVDQQIEQSLTVDERDTYEAALVDSHTKVRSLPCVISGYPVLRSKIEFRRRERAASKEDWNKFVMSSKVPNSSECQDVLRFLGRWCGAPQNPSYSFQLPWC